MTGRHLQWTLALAAGLAASLASGSWAQETPSALPGIFGEVLDVRVVNLEAVVTDKDGVPVLGLRPENFILMVDGGEIPIDYFSEIRNGVAASRETTEGAPRVDHLPAVIPGSPVETSYLVFIDELFSLSRDRDRVLESLISDLPRLGPNDRMAIVAYNGQQLEMLSSWSQSLPTLERALESARERPTYGLQRLAEQRQFNIDRVLSASSRIRLGEIDARGFLRTDLDPNERFYLERLADNIQRSVTAAASTLRSFAMPPGRKVLLLYSGGWPFFPATFLGPNISPIVSFASENHGAAMFRPLTDTANLLGFTIYAVDMPGFADTLADESLAQGADFAGTGLLGDPARQGLLRQQEVEYTLEFLAKETGGKAFINAARQEALDRAVSDTRSYYWIGFTPNRGWDDKRHDIEVRVRQAGLRVRSRAGFLDSSPQHEVAMALESALLFGSPAGTGSLEVEVGKSKPAGRGKMEVAIAVYVPLSEVTLLPIGGEQVANLELRVAVRDESGRRAEIPTFPLVLKAPTIVQAEAKGRYDTALRLRRERHDAVIAVYDPASGRIISTSIEIVP